MHINYVKDKKHFCTMWISPPKIQSFHWPSSQLQMSDLCFRYINIRTSTQMNLHEHINYVYLMCTYTYNGFILLQTDPRGCASALLSPCCRALWVVNNAAMPAIPHCLWWEVPLACGVFCCIWWNMSCYNDLRGSTWIHCRSFGQASNNL